MVKYIVQKYNNFTIYERAEGGYYYTGREADNYFLKFDTKEEAIKGLQKLVGEENKNLSYDDEGFLIFDDSGIYAESINHKYIGEGVIWFVEPINRRGRHRKGYVPYE